MDYALFQRRDVIKSLLAISAVGALNACKAREANQGSKPSPKALKNAANGEFLNTKEFALLSAIAQTIIPTTDTPGAVEAGVPQTLQKLLSNWGDDNFRRYWREGLSFISKELRKATGQDFTKAPSSQQFKVLQKYDEQVFEGKISDSFYKDMKTTVATAYYKSEVGATEELHYEPVPGDWRGDVPFSEIGKAWAT